MFFIAASLGAVAGAVRRTSKPKGGAKGLKFGKMWPLKRKQGKKCYFSPCALRTKLTNSCYPLPVQVYKGGRLYPRLRPTPRRNHRLAVVFIRTISGGKYALQCGVRAFIR